jgi:hypothetical protein
LSKRHPNIGIGIRPRGPLLFQVAEQMSLISDALYLEASAAVESGADLHESDPESSDADPVAQAERIASWIHRGRDVPQDEAAVNFPGPAWLRQPASYSDREWILAIAERYRALDRKRPVIRV